jgi:ATP-dependent exoDNAse (exonuclease V) beta subunit
MDGKNFTVYKSSAGSGKTYTLVREYLNILLRDPESYRHILAITFTNKAANEMKERILHYLKALADPVAYRDKTVEEHLLSELKTSTGLGEQEIRRRASIALKMVMHQYGDFSVSTIDSFFHRVVRTFAHDLKIPLSFQVVVEEVEILEEIVRLLLDRTGTDDVLTKTLVRFIQSKTEDEESWDIEKDLVQFSKVLIREASLPYLARLSEISPSALEDARDSIWILIRRFEELLAREADGILSLLESTGLPGDSFAGASKGMVPWLNKLAARTSPLPDTPGTVVSAWNKNDFSSSKATKEEKAVIRGINEELGRRVGRLLTSIDGGIQQYNTLRILSGYIYHLATLGALEAELQAYRQDNDILLISEFNRRIYDVVKDQPVPFVYERLGEKYRHFLVDEFQDTSVLQWHNILPLVENSLSEGKFNMVVGDGKQAIYRFRSGDVRQFEMLPDLMNSTGDPLLIARQQALRRNHFGDRLGTNFRSTEELVSFNRRFFEMAAAWLSDSMRSVYSDVKQEVNSKEQGYIRLEFIEKTRKDGPKYADVMRDKVLETVDQLEASGTRPGDIAILCRDNRNASQVASWLLSHEKKVVSAESLLLSSSPKVNFLVSWLRYLANPSDEISRLQILYYLMKNEKITLEDFNGLAVDLWRPDRRSDQEAFIAYSVKQFNSLIASGFPSLPLDTLRRKDLFHLIGVLIRCFFDTPEPDPYVLTLQDLILEYTRNDYHSLEDFVLWWDEKGISRSIVTPEGLDAIRVMTIHKAKGLEFPVVILPFIHESLRLTLDNTWVDVEDPELRGKMPFAYIAMTDELENTAFHDIWAEERDKSLVDMLNVLYVAMTRARNQMYLLSQAPPKEVKDHDSIPKMFYHFLIKEGLWQENQQVYSWGLVPRTIEGRKPGKVAEAEAIHVRFPDWTERVLLRTTAPESWDVEDPEKAVTAGKKVHFILSGVRYAEDCPAAMQNALADGIISLDEYSVVNSILTDLVTNPATAFLFDSSWTVRNEAEIIDASGKIQRPDRLMFRDQEAVVVDFKTGRANDHHARQVNAYAALVRELGYRVSGAWIVYLGKETRLASASGG